MREDDLILRAAIREPAAKGGMKGICVVSRNIKITITVSQLLTDEQNQRRNSITQRLVHSSSSAIAIAVFVPLCIQFAFFLVGEFFSQFLPDIYAVHWPRLGTITGQLC